jgi:predicted DNA-binding transcriptional regulator YafY
MDIIEETTNDNKSVVTVNLYTYNNACKRIIEYRNTVEVLAPEKLKEFVIKNAQELLKIYCRDITIFLNNS